MDLSGRRVSTNIVDRRNERQPWFADDIDILQAITDMYSDLTQGTRARFEREPMQPAPTPDEVIERILMEGR